MYRVPQNLSPTFYGTPTIKIKHKCADQLLILAREAQAKEAGCLIVTDEDEQGDFTLCECVVPTQDCHGATTELHEAGLAELGMELMAEDKQAGIKPSDPGYRYNKLNSWFHSHCEMGVSPSSQDDQQMVDFCQKHEEDYPCWVRGIINKKGDIHVSVYYRCSRVWASVVGCPVEVLWEPGTGLSLTEAQEFAKLVRDRIKDKRGPTRVDGVFKPTRYRGYNYQRPSPRSRLVGRHG